MIYGAPAIHGIQAILHRISSATTLYVLALRCSEIVRLSEFVHSGWYLLGIVHFDKVNWASPVLHRSMY